MIKFLQKKRSDPLVAVCLGDTNANIFLFILSLIPNFLATLLEGLSYGGLLLAFNIFSGQGINWSSNVIFSILGKMLQSLSSNKQFILCIMGSLLIQFGRSALVFLSQYIMSFLSLRISMNVRYKIYKQIFGFSYPYFSRYQLGDLASYSSLPDVIPVILGTLNNIITFGLMIIGSLVCMFLIDPFLSITTLVFFGLINYIYKIIVKKMNSLSMKFTESSVALTSDITQCLYNMKLIHVFARQKNMLDRIKEMLRQVAFFNNKINLWNNVTNSMGEVIGIAVISLMLIFGAFVLHNKALFLSVLLLFIAIAYRMATRLQLVLNNFSAIVAMKGSIVRLKDVLNSAGKEFLTQNGEKFLKLQKEIEFKNVSFSYSERLEPAVKDFSFTFGRGKLFALVGMSGAGKSSIVDLMLRIYETTQGQILVDGRDIREFNVDSWRENIGVVNQDIFSFHDTLENNIRFGQLNASIDDITSAAKMAGAHEFINKLPEGYKTIIGERGYKLSGGERQRLALARALVKDPQILILDEATSHLDSHSEYLVQRALESIRSEKTMIIVAHRLSTIVNADQILVFNKGQLIEGGTHAELIEKDGQYAYFWSIQSQTMKKEKQLQN
jgi:ATP-binding cassette, subfamily B, bacterial MsbA